MKRLALVCSIGIGLAAAFPAFATDAECSAAGGSCVSYADCQSVNGVSLPQTCNSTQVLCCKEGQVGNTSSPQPAPPPAPSSKPGYSNFSLQLPSCTADGNCGLDDIVRTGVAFANLLMTLSGALFFASFVYGGAMYLLSFGRSEWVSKGTKAMTGAAIGMGIVLSAWTIVNYIASSLTGKL